MKVLYFDCFSGISGDMALAALLDLEPTNFDCLMEGLLSLGLEDWELRAERRDKNGINANYIKVALHEEPHGRSHEHRNYADIEALIEHSEIAGGAKELSKNIFRRLTAAEAKIHGVGFDEVHFHEVGAVDSIIDIVGTAILLDLFAEKHEVEAIYASPVSDGHGFVECRHGKIPVPVPATVEIFREENVKIRQLDIPKELTTPTGAAIIAEIAWGFGPMPELAVEKTGYGAGTRDLEIPNVLRVMLGDMGDMRDMEDDASDKITVIETNIDDCSPEILAYTMERLFSEGAKDVFFTPIQMKKNRPATKLTLLCDAKSAERLAGIVFSETTAIGVRLREEKRICLAREAGSVNTAFGELKVKVVGFGGERKLVPEYEHAKKLAVAAGVPLFKVYESVTNILND